MSDVSSLLDATMYYYETKLGHRHFESGLVPKQTQIQAVTLFLGRSDEWCAGKSAKTFKTR